MKYKIHVSQFITSDLWFWEVQINGLFIHNVKSYSTRNSAIKAARNAMKKLGLGDDYEVNG